jgi:serine protease SohB
MAFWLDIAAFALKALLIVAAIGGVAAIAALLARGARGGPPDDEPPLRVRSLDERYDALRDAIDFGVLDKKERKALAKARKKQAKAQAKAAAGRLAGKRVYVLSFKGDIAASAVRRFGAEIDAVLIAARPTLDEVVLRV